MRRLKQRSQFTSAVLTGVSAGVIGIGAGYEITLPNRAASDLLGLDLKQCLGQDVRQILPEFKGLLNQATATRKVIRSQEVKNISKKNRENSNPPCFSYC